MEDHSVSRSKAPVSMTMLRSVSGITSNDLGGDTLAAQPVCSRFELSGCSDPTFNGFWAEERGPQAVRPTPRAYTPRVGTASDAGPIQPSVHAA
jgi:hypothetical protein